MLLKKTLVSLTLILLAMVGACSVNDLDDITGGYGGGGPGGGGETLYNFRELGWGNLYTPMTLGLTPGADTTEIGVSWYFQGGAAGRSTHVRFFRGTLEAGTGLIQATGVARAATPGFTTHQVTVRGLSPDSVYLYSVSGDGVNWSALHELRIPPNTRNFRFAIVGDPQVKDMGLTVDPSTRYPALTTTIAEGWRMTMRRIVAREPAFILSMGDQISNQGSNTEGAWIDFFSPPGLRNLPFAPAAGNHDRAPPDSMLHHFVLPNETIIPGFPRDNATWANYFFLYNNVLFVGLNTSGGTSNVPDPRVRSHIMPMFRQTLTRATTQHAGNFDWLIVFHHKSTASVAYHVANLDIMTWVQEGFETLMSEFNVDFVLAGHDHVYARSFPLAGKGGGLVSVPDTTRRGDRQGRYLHGVRYYHYTIRNPRRGEPIYVTFTSSSGEGFYSVVTDPTFPFPADRPFNRTNPVYPFLGVNPATGEPTLAGSVSYMQGNLPVSNAVFHQPRIPSYTIVEVGPNSITFRTYPIGSASGQHSGASAPFSFTAGVPYDSFTVIRD